MKSDSLEWKNVLVFGFRVFGWWRHEWGMFWVFFDDVVSQSNEPTLWLSQWADFVAQSFIGF